MNRKLCKHNIPGIVKAYNNTFHYMFIGHDEEACFDRDIIFFIKNWYEDPILRSPEKRIGENVEKSLVVWCVAPLLSLYELIYAPFNIFWMSCMRTLIQC